MNSRRASVFCFDFREWITAIQKEKPIAKLAGMTAEAIRKRFFICSRHFTPQQYKNSESRSLNLTAVPALNLFNLDDVNLSKAAHTEPKNGVLEESIALSKSETNLQKPLVSRLLNTAAPNPLTKCSKQIVRIVKTTQKVASSSALVKDVKPIANADSDEAQFVTVEESPPAKRFRISLNSQNSCSLFPTYKQSLAENSEDKNVTLNSNDACDKTEMIVDPEIPRNKLLALIEVTPEQYARLSSTLSTNERSENVTSLLSFIGNNELDPSAADNGK